MKKNFPLILTVLIFYGCSHEKQVEFAKGDYVTINAKNINLDSNTKLPLSDFVDNIEIIPLEFTDFCMLKEIRKIVIHNDNIFLIESDKPETIYRFDIQGNFLNRIGARGQGPQELIELLDFSINEEKNIAYLLDNGKQMIYCFDFDGQFIERIFMDQHASRMEYQNGLFYFFRDQPTVGSHLYSLIIRNPKGEIENMYFPSKQYPISQGNQTFAKTKDGLIFHKPMNDTVYILDGKSLNYAWFFDFGSFRFTPDEIEDIYMERVPTLQMLLKKERLSGIDDLFHIGKWVYFNSTYKILSHSFLHDINSGELKVFACFIDDLEYMFGDIYGGNKFRGQTQDAFIGTYNVNNLFRDIERFTRYEEEKLISSIKKEEQVEKMKTIMRGNDTEEMNPWVLIYHLKKD